MTDREKAIVTAYTGITMLSGEKFQIFHKYIEDILGRPVYTHELAWETVWQQIKDKSKDDFIEICKREDGWTPVSERLPEVGIDVLICDMERNIYLSHRSSFGSYFDDFGNKIKDIRAWMPLPEPYKAEGSDKE